MPHTIILSYFQNVYPNFEDFWLFRRQFSYQFAAVTFLTYIMHMNNRFPSKLSISRSTGDVWSSELVPALNSAKAYFYNSEQVPFRLTPNIQTLMGPLATEGIFACAVMAIARCLTEPEHELEQQLSIFVRDEMIFLGYKPARGWPAARKSIEGDCWGEQRFYCQKGRQSGEDARRSWKFACESNIDRFDQ